MQIGSAGKSLEVESFQYVAVYRPDGRVVHLHHAVVFKGGKAISASDAEKGALEHARRRGHNVAELKVLHVASVPEGGSFHVDVAKKALVARPYPKSGK